MTNGKIEKVAVIGAGVMGAGIAAQVANAGVPVLLLDIVPAGAAEGGDRSAIARTAIERLKKTDPAPLMSEKAARLIEPGNIDDDLARIGECDWIVEAVIERLDIKQALYAKIEAARRPDAAVSSNTSTIPLHDLVAGLPETFRLNFLITHFFNPPRYMRLLEVVAGADTDPAQAARVSRFADERLGKSIVRCKDSPGFIANRLGVYWIQAGVVEAIDLGLAIEDADAVMGRPFGIPKTGVFGLADLVGLDLMPHINASLAKSLPPADAFHALNRDLPLIGRMIAEGYTGRKGKGGFYRLNTANGGRVKESIDLATGAYRPSARADTETLKEAGRDLRALFNAPGPVGEYAWRVMGRTLAYAAGLVPEAADDIVAIDDAMRLGYNWKEGPFALIDRVGAAWLVERLKAEGATVPPLLEQIGDRKFYRVENGRLQFFGLDGDYHDVVRPEGVILLEDIRRRSQPVLKNGAASLWDIGDGVACFEITTRGNSLDDQVLDALDRTIKLVARDYKALVIYNEGRHFSVGANLGLALFAANIAAWGEIEKLVATGQKVYGALKHAPFPVVGAPSGMALGGGCELLLHSDAVQAHAETYAGLVECGVGLVPAWGGCKELLVRWSAPGKLPHGPMPAPAKVFEMVSTATVSKSAAEARDMLILREGDRVTMNRDRLLADAKARALELVEGYTPPERVEIVLPGPSGKLAMMMAAQGFHKRGIATDHDLVVADGLADVLSGGDADPTVPAAEKDVLRLERETFMRLARTPGTLARIEHMLLTGKPLRN
ncbi:3-hydroxyacyl-CoA dehydrogenase [Pseudochelatococcus lubricantis]|uniref:3-hydroxyacyl-CoA dehydrogenase n=1 Tax=Pseudochelatococcus lubricantis TaxID=1538102 RepID=A0ABX0UXV3_9HYPH|nr:3-hydroxyacyl-CoA dehydrogenase/enoyl-CoA hydratase family protein [Pseudochelatococcus lubricantis]NIJ57776.1 3-hydroxyacyl-CoA dehydrogenase [Pseudochelatococcus lubricantis]